MKLNPAAGISARFWEWATALIFLSAISILLVFWDNLPGQVPIYVNWPGTVDGHAPKSVLWESLVLVGILCTVVLGLARRPLLLSFPVRPNPDTAGAQQRLGQLMLRTMAFFIALTGFATSLASVSEATGKWGPDPGWLYPAIPIVLIGTPLVFTGVILYHHGCGLWRHS